MKKIREDRLYSYYQLDNEEISNFGIIKDANKKSEEFNKYTELNNNILKIIKYEGADSILNYLMWCVHDNPSFKIVVRKYKLLKIKNKL